MRYLLTFVAGILATLLAVSVFAGWSTTHFDLVFFGLITFAVLCLWGWNEIYKRFDATNGNDTGLIVGVFMVALDIVVILSATIITFFFDGALMWTGFGAAVMLLGFVFGWRSVV